MEKREDEFKIVPDVGIINQVAVDENTRDYPPDPSLCSWENIRKEISTEENIKFIEDFAKRVVQICIPQASNDRPQSDEFRGIENLSGSGFVVVLLENYLFIATNKHILFNNSEVKESEVRFYNGEEPTEPSFILAKGTGLHRIDIKGDHDLTLAVYKLNVNDMEKLERENIPHDTPRMEIDVPSGSERVCIIHYPLLPSSKGKRVSFGSLADGTKSGKPDQLRYAADTRKGSSGSPVLILRRASTPDDPRRNVVQYHIGRDDNPDHPSVGRKYDVQYLIALWEIIHFGKKFCRQPSLNDSDMMPLEKLIYLLHASHAIMIQDNPEGPKRKTSPVQLESRAVAMHPILMENIVRHIMQTVKKILPDGVAFICGVPYKGVLLTMAFATIYRKPLILHRKEDRGDNIGEILQFRPSTGQCSRLQVSTAGADTLTDAETSQTSESPADGSPDQDDEGDTGEDLSVAGDCCLVIDDTIASGHSLLDTVDRLREAHFKVNHAVAFLDQMQGAKELLKQHRIELRSVCTMNDVVEILEKKGTIEHDVAQQILRDARKSQTENQSQQLRTEMRYKTRAEQDPQPVTKKLLEIMDKKKSNLVVAVDLPKSEDALDLIDKIGPHVCAVKSRTALFEDYNPCFPDRIKELAGRHSFLIIEDSKYADIGHVVAKLYQGGLYQPVKWADIITVHSLPGVSSIKNLQKVAKEKGEERGCLVEAEMSTDLTFADGAYSRKTVSQLQGDDDGFIVGFICRSKLTSNPKVLLFAAGVKMEEGKDNSGQNYLTPHEAIVNRGADIIVVGRGITEDQNPAEKAEAYQKVAYEAYLERLAVDERKKETGASQQN